ncbi:SLAC1 family transporter [Streptomyces mirabilis]|uniref:SLAC1 family transporter n=1 Tax=Streptomyces mirabilis TaxID=68239 RepID=UPI0036D9DF91
MVERGASLEGGDERERDAVVQHHPPQRPERQERPGEGLMTSVWIFMGAAAIAVLAGVRLIALPLGSTMLSRPLVIGASVVLWAFSSWLIPLLLALGVCRHALRRIPLRYEFGWWNLVFPVGMYAVTTHELGRATTTSWMTSVGRWEVWIAAVFWAVVFAAVIAAKLRARPTTAHGSAGAGQTARARRARPRRGPGRCRGGGVTLSQCHPERCTGPVIRAPARCRTAWRREYQATTAQAAMNRTYRTTAVQTNSFEPVRAASALVLVTQAPRGSSPGDRQGAWPALTGRHGDFGMLAASTLCRSTAPATEQHAP